MFIIELLRSIRPHAHQLANSWEDGSFSLIIIFGLKLHTSYFERYFSKDHRKYLMVKNRIGFRELWVLHNWCFQRCVSLREVRRISFNIVIGWILLLKVKYIKHRRSKSETFFLHRFVSSYTKGLTVETLLIWKIIIAPLNSFWTRAKLPK